MATNFTTLNLNKMIRRITELMHQSSKFKTCPRENFHSELRLRYTPSSTRQVFSRTRTVEPATRLGHCQLQSIRPYSLGYRVLLYAFEK
ncbi:hypothetical protein TNCT_109401 [Trichonephila clavata]|uniref:Uncharacterized protein n=1 Tax=Trichonephila clavata TaxID=2740835 RepID=A0A8X6LZJ8_TRICU|nr:hypothetical protein TNCT_109401 [Trichonephila clavata]